MLVQQTFVIMDQWSALMKMVLCIPTDGAGNVEETMVLTIKMQIVSLISLLHKLEDVLKH